jgi:DNA-binding cell septation regulator SpoVG
MNPDSIKSIEVLSVRLLEGVGNLRAFVDIRVGGVVVITQCAVLEGRGKRGLFAVLPRQPRRDGGWRDVVIVADDAVRTAYEREIMSAYQMAVNEMNQEDKQ